MWKLCTVVYHHDIFTFIYVETVHCNFFDIKTWFDSFLFLFGSIQFCQYNQISFAVKNEVPVMSNKTFFSVFQFLILVSIELCKACHL